MAVETSAVRAQRNVSFRIESPPCHSYREYHTYACLFLQSDIIQ